MNFQLLALAGAFLLASIAMFAISNKAASLAGGKKQARVYREVRSPELPWRAQVLERETSLVQKQAAIESLSAKLAYVFAAASIIFSLVGTYPL